MFDRHAVDVFNEVSRKQKGKRELTQPAADASVVVVAVGLVNWQRLNKRQMEINWRLVYGVCIYERQIC